MSGSRRQLRRRRTKDYDPWKEGTSIPRILFVAASFLLAGTIADSLGDKMVWQAIGFGMRISGVGLLLCGALSGCTFLTSIMRDRRLVKWGTIAFAEVLTNTVNICDVDTFVAEYEHEYEVTYRFITESGFVIEGTWANVDQPLQQVQPGDRFAMLYDPRKPQRHIAYETALYEVEDAASDRMELQLLRASVAPVAPQELLRPASGGTEDGVTLMRASAYEPHPFQHAEFPNSDLQQAV